MKTLSIVLAALVFTVGINHILSAGPLDPPSGAINSTGRFGPRVDILSLPGATQKTITASGSYYLSDDFDGGIVVQAPDVTIDLNGFSLQGTAGSGIQRTNGAAGGHLVVKNGQIRGFANGFLVNRVSTMRLENLVVSDCNQGVNYETVPGDFAHVLIESVQARGNGANGIRIGGPTRATIRNCTTIENGANGIACASPALIVDCYSVLNVGDDIQATNSLIRGCVATSISAPGGTTLIDNHQP